MTSSARIPALLAGTALSLIAGCAGDRIADPSLDPHGASAASLIVEAPSPDGTATGQGEAKFAGTASGASSAATTQWDLVADADRAIPDLVAGARQATVCLVFEEADGSRRGTGSGVIVDHDGFEALVMTCGHVAREPGRICRVVLADGRVFDGSVLGAVERDGIDLGLVTFRAEGESLGVAPLAVKPPMLGDWVVALGHPRGLWIDAPAESDGAGDEAVDGLPDPPPPRWRTDSRAPSRERERSALAAAVRPPVARSGRVWAEPGPGLGIRFDAPIEAGDSGGPVLDLSGRVVGIASRCGWKRFWNWATSVEALAGDPRRMLDPSFEWPAGDPRPGAGAGESAAPDESRWNPAFLTNLRSASTIATSRSVVVVHSQGGPRSFAVCVGPGGLFVTKGSEVGFRGPIEVESGGRRATAERVSYDPDADLLLLRASTMDLPPLRLPGSASRSGRSADSAVPRAGAQLLSVGLDGEVLTIGTLSLEPSTWDEPDSRPFLGVSSRIGRDGIVRLASVTAGGPAVRAGLRAGDVIRSIGGIDVSRDRPLPEVISRFRVGEAVRVRIERDGVESELVVSLDRRPPSQRQRDRGNTRTSTSAVLPHRTPVFHHDGVIDPHECGSPVISLTGEVVALNAARFDRTATVAIPIDEVMRRIRAMLDQGPDASERFESLAAASFAATEQDGRVRLHALDARTIGDRALRRAIGGVLAPDGSGIGIMADDELAWDLVIDAPGRFEVVYFGALRQDQTARVTVGETSFQAPIGEGRYRRGATLGTIELPRAGRFELRFEWAEATGRIPGNMDRIELRRSDRNPAADEAEGDS